MDAADAFEKDVCFPVFLILSDFVIARRHRIVFRLYKTRTVLRPLLIAGNNLNFIE